jgi:hypothetical protein
LSCNVLFKASAAKRNSRGSARKQHHPRLSPAVKLAAPHASHPIAVQWGEQAQMRFSNKQFISFGPTEMPLFMVDLEIRVVLSVSA